MPGGRRRKKPATRHGAAGFLFTAPFMVLFLLVFIAPLAYALYLSLYREQLIGGNAFVGLRNYTDGLKDQQFIDGVKRVALYMLIQVPVMLLLALVFALIIDSGRIWFARVFRVGIFVPYAVPTVIAALMWGYLYGKDFGPFADLANALGKPPPNFLGDKAMLFSLANVSTWTYTGYNMIILYAALRAIPSELYEAAAVDGAGPFRTALHIKLPLLRPALLLCTIFSVIGSFQLFAEPRIFYSIAPDVIGKAYTPNLYVYNLAFADQRLNYAAALSFLLGAVVFVVSYLVMYASRRQESDDERGPGRYARGAAGRSRDTKARARDREGAGHGQGLRVPDAVHARVPRVLPDAAVVAVRRVHEVARRPLRLVRAVVLHPNLPTTSARRSRRTTASTWTGCATRWCTRSSARSARRCWRPPPAMGSRSSSSGARTCCSGSCSAR